MMKRIWLLLVAVAANVGAQVARVELAPATPAGGDALDHVDLAVHRPNGANARAGLRVSVFDGSGARVSGYAARWASTDTSVAVVVAGTVTAKKAGTARVMVNVNGTGDVFAVARTASLLVCVADTGTAAQPIAQQWPAVGVSTLGADMRHQPPLVLPFFGDTTRFAAIAAGDTTPGYLRYDKGRAGAPWPLPCLHWSSVDTTKVKAVDRSGLFRNVARDSVVPGTFVRLRVGPPR